MKTGMALVAAMLSMFPGSRRGSDYSIPIDTEGTKRFYAKQREAKALEQSSKRKLKKKRGKKR